MSVGPSGFGDLHAGVAVGPPPAAIPNLGPGSQNGTSAPKDGTNAETKKPGLTTAMAAAMGAVKARRVLNVIGRDGLTSFGVGEIKRRGFAEFSEQAQVKAWR